MSGSIWKQEISLRRTKADAPVAPEPEATPVPAPDGVPDLPRGDYGWLTGNFDPNDIPESMPAIAPPKVELAQAEELPAEPELEPVAVALPEPENVPFWKRELKLSRPKGEPKPKAEKAPKVPKEPKDGSVPFWKRELKLSRPKGEPKPKAEKAPKEPKQPGSVPFWKRELKLSRPKGEPTPKAEKSAKSKKVKVPKGGSAKGSIVGLKIGASQVAAARVSNGAHPQLLQVGREPLPDGAVVAGELRDVEALATALKTLFAKDKLPKKNVRLGIANNRIGVRTFEIAGIDEPRQLANAIRFRAQETLPIPLEEAVLDWQVLDEWKDEETGQTTRRVLLVVAYRELVDRYVLACRKAGIRLVGIDLEAFAMLRALQKPSVDTDSATSGARVVVNVGHDRSTFAVADGRVCEFTRVLSWGGQSLSVAIARVLDMTPSEVAPLKHALSLVAQAEPPEGFDQTQLASARDAVVRELQSFARELVSSLRFYQNQPGSLGIAEVVLTGGTAHLPGFADELGRLIGVPVRVGDPLNRVALAKRVRVPEEIGVGSLTVAIGLGIED